MATKNQSANFVDYSEQYKSPLWQKKRLEILERDEFRCTSCKSEDKQLHVHHKEYIKGRSVWDYDNSYLITLCDECHELIHQNAKMEVWCSPDEPLRRARIETAVLQIEAAGIAHKIESINDHKGLLTVEWQIMPTVECLYIVEDAWLAQNEYAVEHFYNEMQIQK
jgi:hypothetical protein